MSLLPHRLADELRDARDRLVASDPGHARLHHGTRAVVAVASTLLVENLAGRALGVTPLLPMLLGAIVALSMATIIRESRRTAALRTAAGSPVAAGLGSTLAVFAGQQHAVGLLVFVAVSFVAVWVRRFGQRWFGYGFLLWQSYFFVLYLRPPRGAIPVLLLAVLVATLWVALLLATVLHDDPAARLLSTVSALRARARAVVSACLDLLEDPDHDGRELRSQRLRLSDVTLLLDGQLADERALPEDLSPVLLRRWAVDLEIGMDQLGDAVVRLARDPADVGADVLGQVRQVLRELGWGEVERARAAAVRLRGCDAARDAQRVGAAAELLLDTVQRWDTGSLQRTAAERAEDGLDEEDFEPVVRLSGGNLPGAAAMAERSLGRSSRHPSVLTRMRLTTRQAIQSGTAAGLAILAGELLSSRRYYWAVIAAFVGFAGTSTAGETLRKGSARVAGTLAGLVAAIAVAHLVVGHTTLAVVTALVCIFCAFYLQALSYGAMIFFLTLTLGQLYALLHTDSDQLLVLRLEETAVGAAIGIGVSYLLLPAGTRDTLRTARAAFLESLAVLLESAAATLRGTAPERDLLALAVVLNADARQVNRTQRSLTYGRFFGPDRAGIRHRVTLLGACAASGRALVAALPLPSGADDGLARVCLELAQECRRLAAVPELANASGVPEEGTEPVTERVGRLLDARAPSADPAADRVGAILARLAESLSLLTRRPAADHR
jgi:hypothetical protein